MGGGFLGGGGVQTNPPGGVILPASAYNILYILKKSNINIIYLILLI